MDQKGSKKGPKMRSKRRSKMDPKMTSLGGTHKRPFWTSKLGSLNGVIGVYPEVGTLRWMVTNSDYVIQYCLLKKEENAFYYVMLSFKGAYTCIYCIILFSKVV